MAIVINPITTILLTREEFTSNEFARFPFQYILEPSGSITYFSKLSLGRYVEVSEASVPGLATGTVSKDSTTNLSYLAHGNLLPLRMFYQVKKFFLDVMDMGPGTYEAQIFIVWNDADKEYRIIVPKQSVSAAAVKYDIGDLLGPDDTIICDIHSHNNMGAFFSGTDDADDRKNPWISGVFGKLSSDMEHRFRFNDGCGRHFALELGEVFDLGTEVDTPPEWISQVTLNTPVRKTHTNSVHADDRGFSWRSKLGQSQYNFDDLMELDYQQETGMADDIESILSEVDSHSGRKVITAFKSIVIKGLVEDSGLSGDELHVFEELEYAYQETSDRRIFRQALDAIDSKLVFS